MAGINALEKFVAKIQIPKCAIDVVSAQIGELNAVRKRAFGEERILDDVVKANVHIPLTLEKSVLHRDGSIQLPLHVINDDQPLVIPMVL